MRNVLVDYLRDKHLGRWALSCAGHRLNPRMHPRVEGPRHLLFAICDHYEPHWGEDVPIDVAEQRVEAWHRYYPQLADGFRDADGRVPRYSFFFPGEEYQPQYLDRLADLAKRDYGEVELHLHHDNDTREHLRATILDYLSTFAEHGHISRNAEGKFQYAFIHGNWCLANARADGRNCGVDDELVVLHETGCYVDMTFPAAPDESQPGIVNQIYWPIGDLAARRAYENGERARVGQRYRDRLLMLEGPLALVPRLNQVPVRIENTHLTGHDPPSPRRIRSWVDQNIHVQGRPEWVFVKTHTHGAPEHTALSLLGEGGRALHRELTGRYNDGRNWILHYVTAREMYNIAIAAMDGHAGNPDAYRDYEIAPPPIAG